MVAGELADEGEEKRVELEIFGRFANEDKEVLVRLLRYSSDLGIRI